jgi:hypothetical protein
MSKVKLNQQLLAAAAEESTNQVAIAHDIRGLFEKFIGAQFEMMRKGKEGLTSEKRAKLIDLLRESKLDAESIDLALARELDDMCKRRYDCNMGTNRLEGFGYSTRKIQEHMVRMVTFKMDAIVSVMVTQKRAVDAARDDEAQAISDNHFMITYWRDKLEHVDLVAASAVDWPDVSTLNTLTAAEKARKEVMRQLMASVGVASVQQFTDYVSKL